MDHKSKMVLDNHVEIRYDRQDKVDELVTYDAGMFHLERMSENNVWMAIYHPNNKKDSRLVVWISAVLDSNGNPILKIVAEKDGSD
jgi:hypothetical protein